MATYNIGQLRRDQIQDYSMPLSYTQGLIENNDTDISFQDQYLYLTGANVVSSTSSYYLRFEVEKSMDFTQDFTLRLQSDEVDIDNVQSIKSFNVKQGEGTTVFELIFTPNASYNQIVFRLKRQGLDYTMVNSDGTTGRVMKLKVLQFERIVNVVSSYLSQTYTNLTALKKIGIQGPPGLLFCLDGEEIQIGKSGIYELYYDGIEISYVGFVIKDSIYTQDGKDYFIMDFKY